MDTNAYCGYATTYPGTDSCIDYAGACYAKSNSNAVDGCTFWGNTVADIIARDARPAGRIYVNAVIAGLDGNAALTSTSDKHGVTYTFDHVVANINTNRAARIKH